MAFVKLDTGILDSTLWIERDCREIFITALLMAEPRSFTEPLKQIEIGGLEYTGFEAPPDWYGFVPAASFGIINRAMVEREKGLEALRRLGEPEPESRSKDFEGRRLIRVDGGFIVLNYMKYRDKDHTAAKRARDYRQRQKEYKAVQSDTRDAKDERRDDALHPPRVTQAESREQKQRAEAEKNGKAPPNPDSGSEMQAAVWLFEELGIPADFGTREVASQAIRLLTKKGGDTKTATQFILVAAIAARDAGETINRFWFIDQKYQPKPKLVKADPLSKMKFTNAGAK